MTNQEAITKLTNIMHDDHYAWHPSILTAFDMAVDALKGAEGDCISRAEAIDICNNAIDLWHGQLGEGALVAVKKGIEGLPSAQPSFSCDHEKDHIAEVSKMDCISRQAAIDFIDAGRLCNPNEPRWSDNEVVNFLKTRPSAQPEPLTDNEQRIFLAAMGREEKVCKQVDEECRDCREPYEDSLVRTCHEITRKVKGTLWDGN